MKPSKTSALKEEIRKKYNIWKTSDIRGSSETSDRDEWLSLRNVIHLVCKTQEADKEEIKKIQRQKVIDYMQNPTLIDGAFFVNQIITEREKLQSKIKEQDNTIKQLTRNKLQFDEIQSERDKLKALYDDLMQNFKRMSANFQALNSCNLRFENQNEELKLSKSETIRKVKEMIGKCEKKYHANYSKLKEELKRL